MYFNNSPDSFTPFFVPLKMQTTEQELLKEIARVAGLINRKKQEQVQPKPAVTSAHPATRSYSKTFSQQTSKNAPSPPNVGKNMTYVRPGAQLPASQNTKTNLPTNTPKIPENIVNAPIASKNDAKNNSKSFEFFLCFMQIKLLLRVSDPNQVTPILKYSKVIIPGNIRDILWLRLSNIICKSRETNLKVPAHDAEHSQDSGNIKYIYNNDLYLFLFQMRQMKAQMARYVNFKSIILSFILTLTSGAHLQ